MKKSKIIIPALAVLCFSTMAAVSGTVAWFTSTTATTISTSTFTITGLDGSLEQKDATPGIGTKLDANKKIEAQTDATLTHGSVDFTSLNVYSKDQEGSSYLNRGTLFTADQGEDADYMENESADQYNVFTWNYEFDYADSDGNYPTGPDRYLYFDIDTSVSKTNKPLDKTKTTKDTSRAFRMLFVGAAVDKDGKEKIQGRVVWSPNQEWATCHPSGSKSSYIKDVVSGTTHTPTVTNYASTEIIYSGDTSIAKLGSGDTATTSRKDYLGTYTSGYAKIKVYCAVWYEGTDVNVENGVNNMPAVSVDLGFYVRSAS